MQPARKKNNLLLLKVAKFFRKEYVLLRPDISKKGKKKEKRFFNLSTEEDAQSGKKREDPFRSFRDVGLARQKRKRQETLTPGRKESKPPAERSLYRRG